MKGDSQAIHTGVTRLSYARTMVDTICSRISSAMSEAGRSNSNPKFKKCVAKSEEVVKQMRQSAQELARIGRTLERLEYIIREVEEN